MMRSVSMEQISMKMAVKWLSEKPVGSRLRRESLWEDFHFPHL
jgi:hypothetical protein